MHFLQIVCYMDQVHDDRHGKFTAFDLFIDSIELILLASDSHGAFTLMFRIL
jgi:hypothetical protein